MTRQGFRLSLCLLLLATGCSLLTKEFTDPTQPVVVAPGEDFVITLDSNATTGYRWELSKPPDDKVLTLVSHEYEGSGLPVPGSGGQEHWRFKAAGRGTTEINLIYRRENQPGNFPPTTFQVTVR